MIAWAGAIVKPWLPTPTHFIKGLALRYCSLLFSPAAQPPFGHDQAEHVCSPQRADDDVDQESDEAQVILLAPLAWRDVANVLEWLDLRADVVLQYVTRDVHQGIVVVHVLSHAGQAGIVVMQQSGLLLGVVC